MLFNSDFVLLFFSYQQLVEKLFFQFKYFLPYFDIIPMLAQERPPSENLICFWPFFII